MFKFRNLASVVFLFIFISFISIDLKAANKIIVKFKSNETSVSLRASIYSQLPGNVRSTLPNSPIQVIEFDPSTDTQQVIERLRQSTEVEYVEEDEIIHAHASPNDPNFTAQWALEGKPININVESAWEHITDSSSITLATIDSGCDLTHEDISPNLWTNPREITNNGIDDDGDGYIDDVNGYDFQNTDSRPQDDYGHGSMVFGIIGARGNNDQGISGINWNAKIMCLKVLDSLGNSTISKAVEAIDFSIAHGVKIINMSWGYTPNGSPSISLEDAIKRAGQAGILIVTSAGNGNSSGMGINNDSDSAANYPSSYSEDNIISVAATDSSDQIASFSNYGVNSVDLAAPGVNIYTTQMRRDYGIFSGTSAAAPHVSGSAALIWALNPELSYAQVKRLLLETTDRISSLSDKTLSSGRLNVGNAIQASPAAGGDLLTRPSALQGSSNTTGNGNDNGEISAQSGGCNFTRNARQTNPAYLFLLFSIIWMAIPFFCLHVLNVRDGPIKRGCFARTSHLKI